MDRGHWERLEVAVTADLVTLTVREGCLQVLLVGRRADPFHGYWELPGGLLRPDEDLENAARRELGEKTGLDASDLLLEQTRVYSRVDRDPRGRVVTVAFLAIGTEPALSPVGAAAPFAGAAAYRAGWMPVDQALTHPHLLAFDHHEILEHAVDQTREKLERTTLAAAFCRDEFTIAELRQVYEAVWGVSLDPGNFSRKVTKTEGFIEPVGARRRPETGRPAELYRRGKARTLLPPLLRP